MDEILSSTQKVSSTSLDHAQKYSNEKNYGRAFAHYLVYVELRPEERGKVETDFVDVTLKWSDHLRIRKRNDNCLSCLHQALEYYPQNDTLLANLCNYLFEYDNLPLLPTLLILIHLHFDYRLDQIDIAFNYLSAIPTNKVHVQIIKMLDYTKNKLVDRWHYRMLNDKERNSAFKKAIEKKLTKGYDTVLDIGTGTGIFSMFAAKNKYSKRVYACDYSKTMIDMAAEIAKANQCDNKISFLHQLSTDIKISDDFPEKVKLIVSEIFDAAVFGEGVIPTLVHAWDGLLEKSPMGKIIPASVEISIIGIECPELMLKHRVQTREIEELNLQNFNIINIEHESYDTETFKNIKNYKCITTSTNRWIIDFSNINLLKKLLNGEKFEQKLALRTEGKIEAFLLWFKLNLDDEISIETRPCSDNKIECWDQAIFYLDESIQVPSSPNIHIALSLQENILKIHPLRSNKNSNLLQYKVSAQCVRFLNDKLCLKAIQKTVQYLTKKFSDNIVNILDLSPFPYLGLLLLKTGKVQSLTCKINTDSEIGLINQICELNNCHSNIRFIEDTSECYNYKFDIIYVNVVNLTGDLNQKDLNSLPQLRRLLKPGGVFLPSYISLYASIIEMPWFHTVSEVSDENVFKYKIAEFINRYKVTEQLDFKINDLEYKALSENIHLMQFDLTQSNSEEQETLLDVIINQDGNAHAILYWFEINLLGNIYNTGQTNPNSFVNNAAFLISPSLRLIRNEQVKFKVQEANGLIHISVID